MKPLSQHIQRNRVKKKQRKKQIALFWSIFFSFVADAANHITNGHFEHNSHSFD